MKENGRSFLRRRRKWRRGLDYRREMGGGQRAESERKREREK